MHCPFCHSADMRVTDTRAEAGRARRDLQAGQADGQHRPRRQGTGTDEAVQQLAVTVAAETLREIRVHGVVMSQHVATEALKLLFDRDALAYLRYASGVYRSAFWTDALALEAGAEPAHDHETPSVR